EVIARSSLEQVRRYDSKTGDVCIRALSVDVEVQLQLSVESTYSHNTFPAGHTSLTPPLLSLDIWHHVNYSLVTVRHRHELAVSVDGSDEKVDEFVAIGNIFTSAFTFKEVILLVKRKVVLVVLVWCGRWELWE
ncbi:hypothetical protein Pcinc_031202, partial [Petrolisthes cinctipes]